MFKIGTGNACDCIGGPEAEMLTTLLGLNTAFVRANIISGIKTFVVIGDEIATIVCISKARLIRHISGCERVNTPHFRRVEPKIACCNIHHNFQDEDWFRFSATTILSVAYHIGECTCNLSVNCWYAVDTSKSTKSSGSAAQIAISTKISTDGHLGVGAQSDEFVIAIER